MKSIGIILAAAAASVLLTFVVGLVGNTDAMLDRWAPVDGVARQAPPFVLQRLGGEPLPSEDLRGQIIVLDFWATWCRPCIDEIDDYNELRAAYTKSAVDVLGVTMQSGSADDIADFARLWQVQYPLFLGDADTVHGFGPLWGYPTTFVIDRDGAVRGAWVGAGGQKLREIRVLLDQLLAADTGIATPR